MAIMPDYFKELIMAIQPKAPSQQQPKQGQQSTQQSSQQGQSWKKDQAGEQSNQDLQKGSQAPLRSGQAQKGQVNQNDMENQADI